MYDSWYFIAATVLLTFLFDVFVRIRDQHNNSGPYWVHVLLGILILCFSCVAWSQIAAIIGGSTWDSDLHFYFDLTPRVEGVEDVFSVPNPVNPLTGNQLPVSEIAGIKARIYATAMFAFIVFVAAFLRKSERPSYWVAGSLGGRGRYWLLLFTVLLLVVLIVQKGQRHYPQFLWSSTYLLALALTMIALSRFKWPKWVQRLADVVSRNLQPWPQAVAEEGVSVKRFGGLGPVNEFTKEEDDDTEGLTNPVAADVLRRGIQHVPNELLEGIWELISNAHGVDRKLVIAPDHNGQAEVLCIAANQVHRGLGAHTLIVLPRPDRAFADRLAEWAYGEVSYFDDPNDQFPDDFNPICVVTADVLSQGFIEHIERSNFSHKIGLVAWWDIHEYTGVYAANCWAISRRLWRVIRRDGRYDVKHIAFTRPIVSGAAQVEQFVSQLLPLDFHNAIIRLPLAGSKNVELYTLQDYQSFYSKRAREYLEPQKLQLFAATEASENRGWRVTLPSLNFVTHTEKTDRVKAAEVKDPARADVMLFDVQHSDVFSLSSMLVNLGRSSELDTVYAGVGAPYGQPYVDYLLHYESRSKGALWNSSRRMVGTEPLEHIIRRHILMALKELGDTPKRLAGYNWGNERAVEAVLKDLKAGQKLSSREVRYIEKNQLRVEQHYESSADGKFLGSLDTVGEDGDLLLVVDQSRAENDEKGMKMVVDRDRQHISAYRGRVFAVGDQRYYIDDVIGSGDDTIITCQQDSEYRLTWRRRKASVGDVTKVHGAQTLKSTGKKSGVRIAEATLEYEEFGLGFYEVKLDRDSGKFEDPIENSFDELHKTSFLTKGILMEPLFGEYDDHDLESLAEALTHVLPVHVGVASDALEVVAYNTEVDGQMARGIAIVDLYPKGIGLTSFLDQKSYIKDLLDATASWLASCTCAQGCAKCVRSPTHVARTHDNIPRRDLALALLNKMVPSDG